MYLDTFKEIYKDKPLKEKLVLFYDNIRNMDRNEQRSYECMINKSKENEEYYRKEAEAMRERVEWLYESILRDIEDFENLKKYFLEKEKDNIKDLERKLSIPPIEGAYSINQMMNNLFAITGNSIPNTKDNNKEEITIKILKREEVDKINNYFISRYNNPVPGWQGKYEYEGAFSNVELGYFILVFNKYSNNTAFKNDKITQKLRKDIKNIFGDNLKIIVKETNIPNYPAFEDDTRIKGDKGTDVYYVKIKYDIQKAKELNSSRSCFNFDNVKSVPADNGVEKELDCFT